MALGKLDDGNQVAATCENCSRELVVFINEGIMSVQAIISSAPDSYGMDFMEGEEEEY